jgi:hypothetical protein
MNFSLNEIFRKQEDKAPHTEKALSTLERKPFPISSNYFVYELGIARISGTIAILRQRGNDIITLYKKEERAKGKKTCYYFLIKNDKDKTSLSVLLKSEKWIEYKF